MRVKKHRAKANLNEKKKKEKNSKRLIKASS